MCAKSCTNGRTEEKDRPSSSKFYRTVLLCSILSPFRKRRSFSCFYTCKVGSSSMKMCTNVLVPWMNGSWESCWYCWFQLKFPRQRLARRNTANTGRLKQNTSFSPTQQQALVFYNSVYGDMILSALPLMVATARSAGGHSTFRPSLTPRAHMDLFA